MGGFYFRGRELKMFGRNVVAGQLKASTWIPRGKTDFLNTTTRTQNKFYNICNWTSPSLWSFCDRHKYKTISPGPIIGRRAQYKHGPNKPLPKIWYRYIAAMYNETFSTSDWLNLWLYIEWNHAWQSSPKSISLLQLSFSRPLVVGSTWGSHISRTTACIQNHVSRNVPNPNLLRWRIWAGDAIFFPILLPLCGGRRLCDEPKERLCRRLHYIIN